MHDDTSAFLTAPAVLEITPATLGGDRLGARHESLRRVLCRIQLGRLALTLPDGRRVEAVGPYPGPAATLHLHRWRPALRLLLQGDLGLAFSYRDGDWSTPDLTTLLSFGIANETAFGAIAETRGPARWFSRLLHRANANTRSGSRHNIAAHYDLGNRFYERWLDDSMLYSSALYEEPLDPSHRESPTTDAPTSESAGETRGQIRFGLSLSLHRRFRQLRGRRRRRRLAGARPGAPSGSHRRAAGPARGPACAGDRLRLGHPGGDAGQALRRGGRRTDAVDRATAIRAGARRAMGRGRPGRPAVAGLPRCRRPLRPHRVDRDDRGRGRGVLAGLLRDLAGPAEA